MALHRETEYGRITVSNELFREAILRAFKLPACDENIWPANKLSVNASYDEAGRIKLEFSAVVKFGSSIGEMCKILSDYLAEEIFARSGKYPSSITVHIVGVKSKNTVKRSMEVVCEY